ncbi:hypothetical protein TWF569_008144 [Orbilia oligospora]|uniref:Uncharacterized protein n=1 Tax=Orbilia oligospora TaxID=2813651 RepID=A0A7C8JUA8_ORBOL|nr:hypothetical protein TWF102_003580 [Orbilia oligospora]KAF3080037.1 hypothetical protein TWF706_003024 [Orbilia oligospora]KAF3080337.1 hypothetical protein TWF103_004208 [Orbilia oligospora]KAF3120436.1 hypothetical protein TWF594_003891 [Orbilia oligospora]KAF3131814.1 hypothetical protein TWF703_007533 [Orbilia oligospora]
MAKQSNTRPRGPWRFSLIPIIVSLLFIRFSKAAPIYLLSDGISRSHVLYKRGGAFSSCRQCDPANGDTATLYSPSYTIPDNPGSPGWPNSSNRLQVNGLGVDILDPSGGSQSVPLQVTATRSLPHAGGGASSAISELDPSTAQHTIENLNTGATGSGTGGFGGIQVATHPSRSQYTLSRYASAN